jgi:uncharacterized protein YlzI (FlbEa/FlbD family)
VPTRISFASGQQVTVAEDEDDVIAAVRRDHPNPIKLGRADGRVLHVNWAHVTLIEELERTP